MAHKVMDRARETSTTTGTGTYSLDGPVLGYQDFDADMATNDTIFYFAQMGADWEVGLGTFTSGSPDTLARTTIYQSSNGDAAVNWGAGIKEITGGLPARFLEFINQIEESITAAGTTDIGALHSCKVLIGSAATITSLGTVAHKLRFVRFNGACVLTHNATSLILPTGANISTAAGDTAVFASDGSGNWRCYSYLPAAGTPVGGASYKSSSVSRASDAASGSVAYTGVGFKPKAIMFFMNRNGTTKTSWGYTTGVGTDVCILDDHVDSANTYAIGNVCMWYEEGGGNNQKAVLASFDADGFTLTWTKGGAPAAGGTISGQFLAMR